MSVVALGLRLLQLAKAYPHLRYVIQDRPAVIFDGVKVCHNVIYP